MEFLSESQLQLISNFRERVKQSEQRLKDTLNTSMPRTPESLPYIHTHGDVSKISDAQYLQTEEQASMNHNMTLGGKGSPPQKHLHPTVFNGKFMNRFFLKTNLLESPNDYADDEDSRINNELHYNREPTDNNFDVSSDSDSEDQDPRIYSLKNSYQVPKGYQNIEKHKTNQNTSTISEREREKLDESYKKHMGIPENKHGYPPKSSSSRHRPEYSSRQKGISSYDENDGLPSQSSHYYEGKLDEYLKSQERGSHEMSSVHSRNLHEMNSSDANYAEELRRLKVPSIRLFEQNHPGHASSNRNRINDSRGSDQHLSQENRSVLRNKDQNIQKMKERPSLKQDYHAAEKDQQKGPKKAPSYPKKSKGDISKERMSYQEKDVSNIENQNINFQNQSVIERNKKTRSISSRKENTGGAKTRPMSKDRKGTTNKAEKKILSRINAETRGEK